MRLSQHNQQKLQHFLHEFRFLYFQGLLFNELFTGGVFYFFEYLRAQDQLQCGINDGVDVFGVFLFAAVVEEDVDHLEAEELDVVEEGVPGDVGALLLLTHDPVDQGDQIIKSVGQDEIIAVDAQDGEDLYHFETYINLYAYIFITFSGPG